MIYFRINQCHLLLLVICSENAVIAPLETLNTNLNYKILDEFIGKITDWTTKFCETNIFYEGKYRECRF